MKVLFISQGDLPDFQCDAIMHGGRSVLGENFVDVNFAWYMYKSQRDLYWKQRAPRNGNSYGRGFTLGGSLPDINIDRENIRKRIFEKEFDFVIYGSCVRCLDYLDDVLKVYSKSEIAFIDGEDQPQLREPRALFYGQLFKRELDGEAAENLHPTNFGIPKEKIVDFIPEKTQDWATVIPGVQETYVFFEEEPYYKDYQKSYFGVTHKKGGWDCLRHYEILMNGCVPYFPDILLCPNRTMNTFPKQQCVQANDMVGSGVLNQGEYMKLANDLLKYTREYLTTEAVFNKMLSKLKKS
jgi:hypothetical protein